MTLKTQIAADIDNVFFNTNDYAESCTFEQGEVAGIPVTAIGHDVEYETTDSEGFATSSKATTWEIPVSDLPNIEPREGARITRTVDGQEEVYEVLPPNSTTPSVAKDESNHIWSLITKRVQ